MASSVSILLIPAATHLSAASPPGESSRHDWHFRETLVAIDDWEAILASREADLPEAQRTPVFPVPTDGQALTPGVPVIGEKIEDSRRGWYSDPRPLSETAYLCSFTPTVLPWLEKSWAIYVGDRHETYTNNRHIFTGRIDKEMRAVYAKRCAECHGHEDDGRHGSWWRSMNRRDVKMSRALQAPLARSAGDGYACDMANWADARLIKSPKESK